MKIVVINGCPGAGKDTFVEFCQKHYTWCLNVSTVDFVKDVARYCGWDGNKTAENRALLSDLKDLLTKWNDVPFKKVVNAIKIFEGEMEIYGFDPKNEGIAFIHCREPHEIGRLCEKLGAESLFITRSAVENIEQSNHADAEVFNYSYNYTIANNGTKEDLEETAVHFMDAMGLKNLK